MFFSFRKVIGTPLNILRKNKKLNTYAFFFFISFSFWFLTMLSKIHETTFLVPIKYINYPVDLLEVVSPADYIHVRVKASGVSIISFQLFNYSPLVLNYNVANSQPIANGKNLFWIMNSKRKDVAEILDASVEIMTITPERIVVPFANRVKKEVPVILNADINLKQTFWLANDIRLTPSSVVLYGEQSLLDSISNVTTELLDLDGVDENQVYEVAFILPNGLECKTNFVGVEIDVEPFIEEVITKEVEIRHLTNDYSMKLFPRNASVILRFSKDKHQLLDANFLRLYIDASEAKEQRTVQIKYDNLPVGVDVERIYPNRLEFLLIKE